MLGNTIKFKHHKYELSLSRFASSRLDMMLCTIYNVQKVTGAMAVEKNVMDDETEIVGGIAEAKLICSIVNHPLLYVYKKKWPGI